MTSFIHTQVARTREQTEDEEQASSSLSSPSSTTSPLTPDDSRAPSAEPAAKESEDATKEPASGPQRNRSSSVQSNGKGSDSKEKRKRSRVTPEQLVHLERFFAMDRSPTAARRKEISESLGMQERQTQIWFQNRYVRLFDPFFCLLLNFVGRRAKAKLQDGKNKGRGLVEMPPDTPPELCAGFDASLHSLIHEDERMSSVS